MEDGHTNLKLIFRRCILGQKNKKEEEVETAGKRFVANMKDVVFVSAMLQDARVEQPPCFCCKKKVERKCIHVVGEIECKDYVLYSESPPKVERKVLNFMLQVRQGQEHQKVA